ncbi:MAG: DUF2017 family protein [Planctomycetota bacterium]|jgi:hypothetical protein
MSNPTLRRSEDGIVLADLAPWFVSILLELPGLLSDDQTDEVKERLFPLPSDDVEGQEEWRRYVHPDLFALIASAREIVERDLAGFEPMDSESPLAGWRLPIPAKHVSAWISALNAGRLNLGSAHSIESEDMDESEFTDETLPLDEKRVAVAKIHLLGWLQQMIIEDMHPPPEGFGDQEEYPGTGE